MTLPKPFVFVLMPFAEEFDDIYKLGIKPACVEAGAYAERADEQIFEGSILEQVYNQISKADIIVADMTDRNPNVFYEVGYAHALGKKVILLTQREDDIPFDLLHYPHIIYENKIADKLLPELAKRVRFFIENPDLGADAGSILTQLEFYMDETKLGDISVIHPESLGVRKPASFEEPDKHFGDGPEVHNFSSIFVIHNSINKYIRNTQFKLGIVAPPAFSYFTLERESQKEFYRSSLIQFPDMQQNLHIFAYEFTLLPDAWEKLELYAGFEKLPYGSEHEIAFRIFTDIGTTDIPVLLNLSNSYFDERLDELLSQSPNVE